jgi:hypothetical protein
MRRLITIFFFVIAGSCLFGQSVPELIYYNFDGSGTSVPNLATTPPTGTTTATIMGGLTQGGSNICDGTMIGTGVSSSTDYVNTGWATNLSGMSWTISMRTSNITSSSTLFYIFGDATAGSFRCFTNGVAGPNNWILRGGFTDVLVSGGAVVAPTMTTFVYDMTLGNIKGYLNGVLVSTVAQAGPTIAGTGPLKVIGYSTNVGCPLNGYLDEFRVYNRALSATEVAELYNPTLSGFLGADQQLCAGDSIALDGGGNSGTYTWSTGASTDSIWVDSADTYTLSISGLCGSGTDTVAITNAPALPGAGFAGPDDTICVGDTIMLSYATRDPILWSTGDTTDTIWVSSPGQYTVTVNGQCGSVEDTIAVDSSALIYSGFAMADTSVACEGDTIGLLTSGSYSSYAWSTGDTTPTSWATTGGTYYVNVSDACGSGSDSVVVSPFIVGVSAGFSASTSGFDATFTDGSTGTGTITYSWTFGDGGTSTAQNPTHTYTANGSYVVTLQVSNECGTSTFSDTLVFNVIGIANPSGMDVSVFPNPAHDRVVVAMDLSVAQDLRVSLVSMMGQVVAEQRYDDVSGSFRQALDLNAVAAGVYFLEVEGVAGKHVTRLVVE